MESSERNLSGEQSVPSRASELSTRKRLSTVRDDKRKPDPEKVTSSDKDVNRKMSGRTKKKSRQTAGNRKGCQDSKMTSASQIKRQWHHQTRMSRERNVKENYFREMTRSTAVTTRRSGGFPIVSPFSL